MAGDGQELPPSRHVKGEVDSPLSLHQNPRPAASPYCWAGLGVWIPHRVSTDTEVEVVLLSLGGKSPDPPPVLLRHTQQEGGGEY